jgi:hypothetical protein
MHVVIIRKEDDYDIVHGFGILQMDPAKTKNSVQPYIDNCQESKDLDYRRKEYAACLSTHKPNEPEAMALREKIMTAEKAYKTKAQSLTIEHAVYFEPKPNEYKIDNAEYEYLREKKENLTRKQLLLRSGDIIESHVGETWYNHETNQSEVISTLKIPEHVKPDKPLSLLKDFKKLEFKNLRKSLICQPFVITYEPKPNYKDTFRRDQIPWLLSLIKSGKSLFLYKDNSRIEIKIKNFESLDGLQGYEDDLYRLGIVYSNFVDSFVNPEALKLIECQRFVVDEKEYIMPQRSVVNISAEDAEIV